MSGRKKKTATSKTSRILNKVHENVTQEDNHFRGCVTWIMAGTTFGLDSFGCADVLLFISVKLKTYRTHPLSLLVL